jgi:metallo-beta-lactamase family protein
VEVIGRKKGARNGHPLSAYQAARTLGREMLDGSQMVRTLGSEYRVGARITCIRGFSARADRDELLAWVASLENSPRGIFVHHGEVEANTSFLTFLAP